MASARPIGERPHVFAHRVPEVVGLPVLAYPTTVNNFIVYVNSDAGVLYAYTFQLTSAAAILEIGLTGSGYQVYFDYVSGDRAGGQAIYSRIAYLPGPGVNVIPGAAVVSPAFRRTSALVYEGDSTAELATVQSAT